MRLGNAIQEYVELLTKGPPEHSDWQSIDENHRMNNDYHARLRELRSRLNAVEVYEV